MNWAFTLDSMETILAFTIDCTCVVMINICTSNIPTVATLCI